MCARVALLCPLTLAIAALAQPAASDVERMAAEGMTEALSAKLGEGRTPDDKHLLAQAWANRARAATQPDERDRAFEQAGEKYRAWLGALQKETKHDSGPDIVRLAAARVEFGRLLMSGRAASALDELELTAGRRGDRALASAELDAARAQFEAALAALKPLLGDLRDQEEQLLASGTYEQLARARLDALFNLGWANYHLALLTPRDEEQRQTLLAGAERRFRELLDLAQAAGVHDQCRAAIGMVQHQRGALAEAERTFERCLATDVPPRVAAQARYEWARCQLELRKFDEARQTLKPLVEKDPDELDAADAPLRWYVNLAQLWDANSHLVEAQTLSQERRGTPADAAILQKARRAREAGLARMQRLAQRGGPWPGLVQMYVAASVDPRAPLAELAPLELFCTAGILLDQERYRDALERLAAAAARADVEQSLAGDVLFDLGRCQQLLKDDRQAATNFQKLATEHAGHGKAAQAAALACQLWAQVAADTSALADYEALAAALQNLLERFADHPQRTEAAWLLPVALQLAQRYEEAADRFAQIPRESARWEEAQYRQVVCQRRALEAARPGLTSAEYTARARRVAATMSRYADDARKRCTLPANGADIAAWSAAARVSAAELLTSVEVNDPQAALAAVEAFEVQYPGDAQLGRVLAVRIRAFRSLRQFDSAARILRDFLQAAAPETVGATLAGLAQGMQEEAQRLVDAGQNSAAEALAQDALVTFDELEKWVRADRSREKNLNAVLHGRAQMLYLARRYDDAEHTLAALLERSPNDGNYRRLRALVLTARLPERAAGEQVGAAREAWAVLLSDPGLRQKAAEQYWEARYNWLALTLRLGEAADVEKAITQEKIWRPDLGGPKWLEKFEALLRAAREERGARD